MTTKTTKTEIRVRPRTEGMRACEICKEFGRITWTPIVVRFHETTIEINACRECIEGIE